VVIHTAYGGFTISPEAETILGNDVARDSKALLDLIDEKGLDFVGENLRVVSVPLGKKWHIIEHEGKETVVGKVYG
jgi:hypothetical protein